MRTRDIVPAIATGLLLAAAFPNASLWPLAYIGLVPLFLWLSERSYLHAFLHGALAGLVFYLITFSWFAALTYWVGGIVLLGVCLLFLFFSLFWGVVAIGYCFVSRRMPIYTIIALPSMWVLMEYIHNHIFTGFGWGSLGYTQWNSLPVAQLASIGSVYSTSFYLVGINAIICLCINYARQRQWRKGVIASASIVAIITAVMLWGSKRMQEPDMSSSLRVGIIQPNFSLDVKWSSEYSSHTFETQRMLTDIAVRKGAEFVVWPESALYGYLVDEIDKIAEIVRPRNIYFLTGSNHYEHTGTRLEDPILYYNSAFLVNPHGQVLDRYDKKHLAPFGEYVPLAGLFPFLDKVVPQVADFTAGTKSTLFDVEGKKFCVLICFENSFPHLVRTCARSGADFLVQLTNDGWFGRTSQPKQDLAIAVFRAIENGATLVRGTNTGISCFIDPWGRISGTVRAPWGEIIFMRGTSVETISTVPHDTFYKAYGDIWVLGCLVLLAGILGLCASHKNAPPDTDE